MDEISTAKTGYIQMKRDYPQAFYGTPEFFDALVSVSWIEHRSGFCNSLVALIFWEQLFYQDPYGIDIRSFIR